MALSQDKVIINLNTHRHCDYRCEEEGGEEEEEEGEEGEEEDEEELFAVWPCVSRPACWFPRLTSA